MSFVVHIPFIPLPLNRDSVLLEEKFHNSLLERARLEGELETTRQSDQLERDALKSQNASLRDEIKTQKTQLQAEVTREHDKVINLEQELQYSGGFSAEPAAAAGPAFCGAGGAEL